MTNHQIIVGDNRETLKTLADNSIDAVVTDPPYGIDFLGKDWDANTGALETYQECLRVLKPGGYLLAFSAARTYHHLAVTVEQAGFEIKDQLMWLYATGFPKAHDIGKMIDKRAGAKRKVVGYTQGRTTTIHGGGQTINKMDEVTTAATPEAQQWEGWKTSLKPAHEPIVMARKPFKGSCVDNVLEHGVGALNIDATRIVDEETNTGRYPSNVMGEIDGYEKFFYCPKVSRAERNIGYDNTGNIHPTVKPVELMKYLIKLVTPQGGIVLDPFCGSGSTGMAAVELGNEFIGCELDPEYASIADTRITAWSEQMAKKPYGKKKKGTKKK